MKDYQQQDQYGILFKVLEYHFLIDMDMDMDMENRRFKDLESLVKH